MNWSSVLDYHAVRTPEKPITVFEAPRSATARWRYAPALAAGCMPAGGPWRRGGPALVDCPEFLETVFAANYLGAIAMPINCRRLAAPEVAE